MNHLGILLKCEFWFSICWPGPVPQMTAQKERCYRYSAHSEKRRYKLKILSVRFKPSPSLGICSSLLIFLLALTWCVSHKNSFWFFCRSFLTHIFPAVHISYFCCQYSNHLSSGNLIPFPSTSDDWVPLTIALPFSVSHLDSLYPFSNFVTCHSSWTFC